MLREPARYKALQKYLDEVLGDVRLSLTINAFNADSFRLAGRVPS